MAPLLPWFNGVSTPALAHHCIRPGHELRRRGVDVLLRVLRRGARLHVQLHHVASVRPVDVGTHAPHVAVLRPRLRRDEEE